MLYKELPLCCKVVWSQSIRWIKFISIHFFFWLVVEGGNKLNLPSLGNPVVLLVQGVVQARPLRAARC